MATVHASAVLVGPRALLIRGPAGAGKSRLALRLIQAQGGPGLPFCRLVTDDRAHIWAAAGGLLVRPPDALAGCLEIRGLGVRRLPFEPLARIGWVVDLGDESAARMPEAAQMQTVIEGVSLPRLAFPPCADPLAVLLAALGAGGPRQAGMDDRGRLAARP